MFLEKIRVINFRNLKNIEIDFSQINILYGKNAQGKTNLLESIYFLFTGKSFRTFMEKELVRWKEEFLYIKGNVYWQGQNILVESALNIYGDKKMKINQKIVRKQKELIYLFPLILFTHEEVLRIKEEPAKRRFLLDRFLATLFYSYNKALNEYQKALYQRNLFLRNLQNNKELEVWNKILVEKGSNILWYRLSTLKEMEKHIKDVSEELLGEDVLEIEYKSSFSLDDYNEKKIKESFEKNLIDSQSNDLEKKYTNIGPHRDDVVFYWKKNGERYNLKNFGSGGERKIAFFIWKLAELRLLSEKRKEKAILLIDDLFSELDEDKQKIFWTFIKDFQIFITSTYKLKILENFPFFEIISGEVYYHA
ncbi:MAG: DNA replication and repair protein RecF [Dictyoglomaceae bacterium]|nr:DNA replication and repair protein RecF [Dictyoglomaceae bacterium]